MKSLSFEQMEKVQGGVSKSDWCTAGATLAAVGGFCVGGPLGCLAIMSATCWMLSC